MGNFCSSEESRRQRAADLAATASSPLGAALSPVGSPPPPHHLTVRQHLDGTPRRKGKNSVFGFVESPTERSGTMDDDLDDDDDPGIENEDDDEEETIEFYSSAVERHGTRLVSGRSQRTAAAAAALSTERKQQIERMIAEEEGDNAAVLRRILAKQLQSRDPPSRSCRSPKPTTPPVVSVPSQGGTFNSSHGAQTKKKRFGFRNKKKNKTSEIARNDRKNVVASEPVEPHFTTLVESVQTRVIREEDGSSESPSDEENIAMVSPSIPKGIVQRRTTQFTSHGVSAGPLVSIKLKTQSTASPDSITIRSAAPPSSSTTTSNTTRPTPLVNPKGNSKNKRHGGKETKTPKSTASVEEHQYSEFQKLQLKAAVAKKRSQRQHKVAKAEDRLKDVQGYRELWDSFAKIQETVVTTATLATGQLVLVDANVPAEVAMNATSESKSPAPQDDNPDLGSPAVVDYDLEEPISSRQPSIEYDLAEDLGFMKSSGSSIASSIRSLTSRKSNRTHGSTGGGSTSRRRHRFRRRSQKMESESAVVVPDTTMGDDSFSLKEAQKWYFDFQDEFEISNNNPPEVCLDHDSNSSQASLSLLSQNSLDAQRRFFADKRRQRKLKEQQRKGVPVVVTPSGHSKMAGYGMPAVHNKLPVGGGDGRLIELDETPIAGNLRRDSTKVPEMGLRPAQQLLASKDNPALRLQIAANILKSRSLTNMEVAFSSPESDVVADDASMVSDLDDNMSVTSIGYAANDYGVRRRPSMNSASSVNNRSVNSFSNRHHQSRNDYGAQHRQRRIMTSQCSSVASHGGDRSSIGRSDCCESHSEIQASAYDHELVLQRRLEIEARLRALKAEDEEENAQELPDTAQVLSELDSLHPSPSSPEAQDDYTLPAVLSPQDVRSQRKRGKSSTVVYSAVACDYLGSPMLSGKVPTSPVEPISSNAQNTPPDGAAAYPIVSAANVMSRAAKRIPPFSKATGAGPSSSVGVSRKRLSKLSRSDRKDFPHQLSPIKLDDSFESSVDSKPRITQPYLRAARASSSKKKTAVTPDDNDSLVTSSVVSVSSTAPSSASGKDQAEAAVCESGGISSEARGLDGARETLLLADQVEAHVKDVLNRYRSAPETITTCSDEDDDQPPRIVSSRASWIR